MLQDDRPTRSQPMELVITVNVAVKLQKKVLDFHGFAKKGPTHSTGRFLQLSKSYPKSEEN